MARNEQLVRQMRLLRILENSRLGKTLEELCEAVIDEVGLDKLSERTIRRDLDALQAAGFDLENAIEGERGSIWRFGSRLRTLPRIDASATELLALSMGRDLLTPLEGTPFWGGIESFWTKLKESLPESVWKHFVEQRSAIVVLGGPAKSYGEKRGIFNVLNNAIRQHRVVEIEYQSAHDLAPRKRIIHPYVMAVYKGSVYLVASDETDAAEKPPRHWKLDRFTKADPLDRRFKPKEDFDPDRHFAQCLGVYKAGDAVDAVIEIAGDAALWVEENPWCENQRVERGTNGKARLYLNGVYEAEILSRVLALGPAAEILEPTELRDSARAAVAEMAKLYNH